MRKALLALLTLVVISPLMAFEYLTYDLTNDTVTKLDAAPSDIGTYRGTTMLMVKMPDSESYIGVFEVTNAQAHYLFQGVAESTDTYSYTMTGEIPFNTVTSLNSALRHQTKAEWESVAGPTPTSVTNLYNLYNYIFYNYPSTWTNTNANTYGVIDIWGNASEYCSDNVYVGGNYMCAPEDLSRAGVTKMASGQPSTARMVYTPPAVQDFTLTINGTLQGKYKPDTVVDLDKPALDAGKRFTAVACEQLADLTLETSTITMPAANVVITYTIESFVYMAVNHGTSSDPMPALGATVTFTRQDDTYAPLYTIGEADPTDASYTIPTDATPGSTITATFLRYPRVQVYGGTVTVDPETSSLGNGYYATGSTLNLSTATPTGYKFDAWECSEELTLISNRTLKLPANGYDKDITITAKYSLDSGSQPAGATIDIGSSAVDQLPFGYSSVSNSTAKLENITYNRFSPVLNTKRYVDFDLDKKTYTYTDESAASDTNTTTHLILQKIYQHDDYLGRFETTAGQFTNVINGNAKSTDTGYAIPFNGTSDATNYPNYMPGLTSSYLTKLSSTFAITATLPTVDDYLHAVVSDQEGVIDTSKIVCDSKALVKVNEGSIDPAGFYNIYGNQMEYCQGPRPFGGSRLVTGANNCLEYHTKISSVEGVQRFTFRPIVRAETPVTLTIDGIPDAFPVRKGTEVNLGTPVKHGYAFDGWYAGETLVAMPYTVAENVTLAPKFTEQVITATYVNCSGPATLYPGQTIQLYLDDRALPDQISSDNAAITIDGTKLTVGATATGSVTITAKQASNGYIFILR